MPSDRDDSSSPTTAINRSGRLLSSPQFGTIVSSGNTTVQDNKMIIPPASKCISPAAIARAVKAVAVGRTKIDVVCDPETFKRVTNMLEFYHCHHKMQYDALTGEVIVREVSCASRQSVKRWVENNSISYNIMVTGDIDAPIESGSIVTFAFGPKALKADCSFYNPRVPYELIEQDSNGRRFPSIVMEVARSETWADLMSTVTHYLQWQCVRAVITITLIGGSHVNTPRYYVCTVHIKNDNDVINVRVINFGPGPLLPSTVGDIETHVGVPCADFSGMGYGYEGEFPYPSTEMLPVDPNGALTVEIPAGVIWHNVPTVVLPPMALSWRTDLRRLFNTQRGKGFWDKSMVAL